MDECGDPGYQLMTDENIIEQVTNPRVAEINESDSDDESDNACADIPMSGQVIEMLQKCLKWYEHQSEATPTSLLLILKRIRDLVSKK